MSLDAMVVIESLGLARVTVDVHLSRGLSCFQQSSLVMFNFPSTQDVTFSGA